MQKQTQQGAGTTPVDQPSPAAIHKKNAWWRQPRENRTVRGRPYVISEGDVWFGRRIGGNLAWVWTRADETSLATKPAANDARIRGRRK